MRVLITGAAGFLGRHFLRYHMERGDQVVGVDNLSGNTDYPIELVESEILVIDDAEHHLKSRNALFDVAYHFAAPVGGREKIEGDPLYNADSLRLDAAFFRWAAANHETICVYPSSSAVYGSALQSRENALSLQEGMFNAANPNWPAPDELYGFTKLVGEMLAWKAAKYGTNTLVLRPFSGYGEGQSFEYPVPSIAARAVRREDPLMIWGSGQQRRDFVHVSDIVKVTEARLTHPILGYETMNVGSGKSFSFREIAQICTEIIGYSPIILSDSSKPQGVMTRWASINRMERFYPREELLSLRSGLERVIADVELRLAQ